MFETELVLNVDFGGFSFDTEMALWLMENRNWKIISQDDYNYKIKDYPINVLIEHSGDYYFSPHSGKIELRSNQDLIDCVRALQKLHENDSFRDKYYGHIFDLAIKKVRLHLSIEDYYDGKEKISSYLEEV